MRSLSCGCRGEWGRLATIVAQSAKCCNMYVSPALLVTWSAFQGYHASCASKAAPALLHRVHLLGWQCQAGC
jgi:hypothetical protein